jgi:hypothetical protein
VGRKDKKRQGKHHVPPAAQTAGPPQKIPRVGEEVEFWNARPIWSFALLDLVATPGGWIHLRQEDLDELLLRFRRWETMTWGQILAEGRKQNHPIDVSKCSREAQERLRFLKLDDQEQLMSLSVNSRARVIGILDRATFRILWWDPDHQICPSQLKHT